MARSKWTLDDAAVAVIQLESGNMEGARQLRDRLRRLQGRSDDAVAAALSPALDALAGWKGLSDEEKSDRLAEAGRSIEGAMVARDDLAEGVAVAAEPTEPVAGSEPGFGADDAPEPEPVEEVAGSPEVEAEPVADDPSVPAWQVELGDMADPELLEGFVAESDEHLRGAEAALLALEGDNFDAESVNSIFRCFHTIKGTSAFLGLDAISDLAHRAESLMSRVRDREIQLTGGFADLALRSVDVLDELLRGVSGLLAGRTTLAQPTEYGALVAALEVAATAKSMDPVADVIRKDSDVVSPVTGPVAADDSGSSSQEGGAEAFTRVRTERLDGLLDMIGELVIAHSMIAQDDVVRGGGQDLLSRKVVHAGKIVRELQDLSTSMRMVPLKAVFQKLARVCRDAARKSGKNVLFLTEGEDTEIDRNMVDVVADPLVHMVRNAVDHGLELPDDRVRAGKPRQGTVKLKAEHSGGNVVLTLQDDGRGLDRGRILAKAVANGLIDADRTLSDRDAFELIFAPGFSTAEQVTGLSGRGVGLDVVRRNVEALHGRVEIESEDGQGTLFRIRVPLTLAITDGMLIGVGPERYILPTVSIQLSFRPERSLLSTVAGRGELVTLRGDVLPIVRLHRLLDVDGAEEDPTRALLVVVASGGSRCALLVDELIDQQQVVAKTLGAGLGHVHGVSGGAILGDGRVGLILDVAELVALSKSVDGGRVAA